MIYRPYEYQRRATKFVLEHSECGLLLDMGLGKSIITLTAIQELIDDCEISRVLVVAPKKVAETTWTTEAAKWDHLQGMKVAKVLGTEKKRKMALAEKHEENGLIDLWGQMYCIDMGQRLGKSVTKYRESHFETHKWNNIVVRCDVKKGHEDIIRNSIADICLRMEHDGETANILANSAAGLMNKLAQFANGAVYDDERNIHEIHNEKVDKLAEIVEAANGNSVLVFYQFKHDIPRITKKLKGYRVEVYEDEKQLLDWNAGKIDVLLAHPASTAYGLNMQQGGHYIVWFGTGWDLELFQQANARLHRQGQQHPVTVYKLIGAHTVDERASASLENKKVKQQSL